MDRLPLLASLKQESHAAIASLCALASCLSLAGALEASAAAPSVGPAEARTIAEEGFVYGLPMVMGHAVMYDFVINRDSAAWRAPFNTLRNEARVFTSADTTVVTPNSDRPYSMAWADLRTEPIVTTVPDVDPERYYSVHLVDSNTFNYGLIGTRTTGNGAGNFMIVGPRWEGQTPADTRKVFRSSAEFSLVLFRARLLSPHDMPNVEKVQAGYRARPLSEFIGKPAPAAATEIDWPAINPDRTQTPFFECPDFLMAFAPPSPEETTIRAKVARMVVGTGTWSPPKVVVAD